MKRLRKHGRGASEPAAEEISKWNTLISVQPKYRSYTHTHVACTLIRDEDVCI
jgi:hypothetical protein